MLRPSIRSFLLLTAPVLVIPLVAFWVTRASKSSGISIEKAVRHAPSPLRFLEGADVSASLHLNESPDNNAYTTWKVFSRIEAGGRALWNSKDGDGAREISREQNTNEGAFHRWKGTFDLKSVPPEWGEVTLHWSARLTHIRPTEVLGRKLWSGDYRFARTGKIVLRRAGETLDYSAQIDKKPRVRLLDYSLWQPNAKQEKYRLRLFVRYQNDGQSPDRAINAFRFDYEIPYLCGSCGERHRFYGAGSKGGDDFLKAPPHQLTTLTSFEMTPYMNKPVTRARAEGKIIFGESWPLQFSFPLAVKNGRLLPHRSRITLKEQPWHLE